MGEAVGYYCLMALYGLMVAVVTVFLVVTLPLTLPFFLIGWTASRLYPVDDDD